VLIFIIFPLNVSTEFDLGSHYIKGG